MDLTTAAAVKAYLPKLTSAVDELLGQLISRESREIERYTSRTFPRVTRTLRRLNGTGTPTLYLPDQPVLDVTFVSVSGANVPAAASSQAAGYMFDERGLYLNGGSFAAGRQNVVVSWTAGWTGELEAAVPSGNAPVITPSTSDGWAGEDISVTLDGVPAAKVAGSPAAGEYAFSGGAYAFNAADAGATAVMSFYAVPAPVAQACIEMVALDLQQRSNIGIKSKGLAGESVSYETGEMTPSVKTLLQSYRQVAPL